MKPGECSPGTTVTHNGSRSTTAPRALFVLGAVEEILRVECHQWELPNKAVRGDTHVVDGSWRERTLRKAKGKWHGSRQAE